MIASADFAAERASSVRGLSWASIEHWVSSQKRVVWLGMLAYTTKEMLLEVEFDISVLFDYSQNLDI